MVCLWLFLGFLALAIAQPQCCKRGESCWPTDQELRKLEESLDPNSFRSLRAQPGMAPPCAFPIGAGGQPLYGQNSGLRALYVRPEAEVATGPCVYQSWGLQGVPTSFCSQAVRNCPQGPAEPAFIAWPLTTEHVQTLVRFASDHNLCLCIAATGHDWLNRHSCPSEGLMIRTSLLKSHSWAGPNALRVGAGLTFGELNQVVPDQFLATGWCGTVGVVGWVLGGGHGPFGRQVGLGADNLLAVEIVTADGQVRNVTESENADLLRALRGGGGSTWGVVTSLTFRTFPVPEQGFVVWWLTATGPASLATLDMIGKVAKDYVDWSLALDPKFSGLAMFTLPTTQGAYFPWWGLSLVYKFPATAQLPETMAQFRTQLLLSYGLSVTNERYERVPWNYGPPELDAGLTPDRTPGSTYTGFPSQLLSGEVAKERFSAAIQADAQSALANPATLRQVHVFHDLPGTRGLKPVGPTSIGSGFRAASFLVVLFWDPSKEEPLSSHLNSLGADSYFSESAFSLPGSSWKDRYWGSSYERLLEVKRSYDPNGLFYCWHCVGSEEVTRTRPSRRLLV